MAQIHFEVFSRRKSGAGWTLELAIEDRAKALATAEEMLAGGRAIAVKVTKETLNEETREFQTISILAKGEVEPPKAKKAAAEEATPLCTGPSDLYTGHARERIGRLLGPWLARNRATPFELLHSPTLIERLEVSHMDLRHAIQKIAIPEAQAKGVTVHEVMRSFQKLAQAAIDRVLKDARKGAFPKITVETFAATIVRFADHAEKRYVLGAAVCELISQARDWREKVGLLLDLADAAPQEPKARAFALSIIEQPLAEALGPSGGLNHLLGPDLDLGGTLAAMTRLAAADAVEALVAREPAVALIMPRLEGSAARLSNWLDGEHFAEVRGALGRKVLSELNGPRRLCPTDAQRELDILRALALSLISATERMLTVQEVQAAFVERSKLLVRTDFVEDLIGRDRAPLGEVEVLIKLAEHLTGAANKREAGRWIMHSLKASRLEQDLRSGKGSPAARLAALQQMQRAVGRAELVAEDAGPIVAKIGELGGLVEADAGLVAALAAAKAPAVNRLMLLLKLASGDAAPLGPAADRARIEALKLLRAPETREALGKTPEALDQVRGLLKTVGMAA